METDNIPTTGNQCQELYSDIRTDSFDVLAGQYYGLDMNLSINHHTLISNPVCSFENTHTTGSDGFDCGGSDVIEDSSSMSLNIGDSCLSAASSAHRYLNPSTAQAVVSSPEGHDAQQNQRFLRMKDDSQVCHRMSAKTKQDGMSDISINSFDTQNNNLDLTSEGEIKTCYKDKNDSYITVAPSTKIVTAESESGALHMFLIDAVIDFDEDNSCNSSLQLKTHNSTQISATEELHECSKDEIKHKEKLTVNISMGNKVQQNERLEEEFANDHSEEAELCNNPSRRSLRLKADKRSASSFSYQMYSDNENVTDVGVLITKRNSKSQSPVSEIVSKLKTYTCDVCGVICKTASNLKQHKQTHNISKEMTCTHCGYSCRKKSDMRKHEDTHDSKNLYKCVECGYSGKRLRYLKKHMRTHSKDISFSCHLCNYRPGNKAALANHLLGHSSLRPHSCVDCGESFKKKSTLSKHMVQHSTVSSVIYAGHKETLEEEELSERYEVRQMQGTHMDKRATGDITSSNTDQETHKLRGGSVDNAEAQTINAGDNKTTIRNTNVENSNKNTNNKSHKIHGTCALMKVKGGPIQCLLCSFSCTSQHLLERHMRRHSDNKPFICQQCGASFKRKDHLNVHRLTHRDIHPYKCPHCLYGTHRRYRLKLHILTHQTIKPVKCSLCVYSCRRDCELRYHMRNKHGIEPEPAVETGAIPSEVGDVVLKCELCGYTCDSQKRLKYHMARHENKTPHSCPHCDYRCSSRSSLADHLLQHAGIKPCLCSVCGMAFRNTSRLNRHKLVHSDIKPYGCGFCEFSSRSKYNLKQHVLRHTDQERARRRNRKPPKPHNSNSTNVDILKQSLQSDIQPLTGHSDTDFYPDSVQSQRDDNQMTQELKNSSKYMESFQSAVPLPQYINRNQMDMTYDHYRHLDKNLDHSSSDFNAAYQSVGMNVHSYHLERASCPSALNPAPSYSDPYQNANPFLVHSHSMSYNANLNTGHTNPNFCYVDRNGSGYGFANSYFYNETVFPGNLNANMNFYVCPGSNNTYALNPSPTLPINQNLVHLNPPVSQTTHPVVLPALAAPLIPVIENQSQSISETEDSHVDSLTMSEDISVDVPVSQRNKMTKPNQSRSQAKVTGAMLNGNKVITKNAHSEQATKLTHMCSECGYICLTNTMLLRHKTTHIDLKPHKCDDCGKSFKRMDHMKAHKRTHDQDKPFHCKHCSYTCSRKYRLKLHEMTHTNEHSYSGSACENTFDAEREPEEHTKVHSDGFTFACNKCEFRCTEKTDVRCHNESHKTFLCEECSYVCRSSREFKSHKRMHAEKEELVCSLCSYTCDSQKRLKYHMERHKNKTPHACPHCDYKCSSRSSLTDHLLQHEGLKPFQCSVCGMKFRNVSRLNRHNMTHTDIKPHTCEYCPFSSRSRYNLKQHMLRHFK